MIFLTVGSELPFDRLVRAMDDFVGSGVIREEVFAQVGRTHYEPSNMEWVATLEKSVYDRKFAECRAVVSHAGMGTIIKCMEVGKPLLVMPREKRLGEIISDHQIATSQKFEARGDILLARNTDELRDRLVQLETFRPSAHRGDCRAVVDCIKEFLRSLEGDDRR